MVSEPISIKAVRSPHPSPSPGTGEGSRGSGRIALGIGLRAMAVGGCAYLIIHLLTTTQLYATTLVIVVITALLIADLVRVVARLQRSTERFLENLTTDVVETPLHAFAGQARVLAAFERAAHKLNAARSEQRQALDHLQTLLDTVAAALIVVHADGRIKLANRAARKLAGEAVAELSAVAAIGPAAQVLLALPPGARQIVQMADGTHMLAAVGQLTASGRAPERLLSLQRISGELDAVELKAWQDMARVLAHEMMNSLTPIASLSESLELLFREERGGAPQERVSMEIAGALEAIKRRSQGLMNFVDRYRKLAELPQPRLQTIRMSDFLAGIERLMSASFKDRHITYRGSVLPQGLSLKADPELLEQAVINLLRNACDAVADSTDACVEIACERRGEHCVIVVADNGRGLAEPEREQIFLPFYTTKAGGSGIGLNLARHIALAHGGQLEARNRAPRGAVFELRLPLPAG